MLARRTSRGPEPHNSASQNTPVRMASQFTDVVRSEHIEAVASTVSPQLVLMEYSPAMRMNIAPVMVQISGDSLNMSIPIRVANASKE